MKIRRHYIFHGRVQGVGFRFTVYRLATHLGLTGWVKNNYDGTVEAIIQGENTHVVDLLRHLYDDDYISISHIDMEELKVLLEETSFTVKY